MIFGKRFLFAALAVAAALGCLFGNERKQRLVFR